MDYGHTLISIIFYILIIFIVVIVILLLYNYYSTTDKPKIKNTNIDIDTLKSGDIVCVGYVHIFGKLVRGLTKSVWTHTGVIWKDQSGGVYVCEFFTTKKRKTAVAKVPIEMWCKLNRKHIKSVLRYNGPKIEDSKFEDAIEKYGHSRLNRFGLSWVRFLKNNKYSDVVKDEYTCNEFTINLLQDINIYKKTLSSSSYLPYHIADNLIETVDSVTYDQPIQFDFKYDYMLF